MCAINVCNQCVQLAQADIVHCWLCTHRAWLREPLPAIELLSGGLSHQVDAEEVAHRLELLAAVVRSAGRTEGGGSGDAGREGVVDGSGSGGGGGGGDEGIVLGLGGGGSLLVRAADSPLAQ